LDEVSNTTCGGTAAQAPLAPLAKNGFFFRLDERDLGRHVRVVLNEARSITSGTDTHALLTGRQIEDRHNHNDDCQRLRHQYVKWQRLSLMTNNTWSHIKIKQSQANDQKWHFTISINGVKTFSVINPNPRTFSDVTVWGSNPFLPAQPGRLRNIIITTTGAL